jgi:hypothetical protein
MKGMNRHIGFIIAEKTITTLAPHVIFEMLTSICLANRARTPVLADGARGRKCGISWQIMQVRK